MKLNVENTYNAKYLAMLPHWKCHKVVQAGKISFMARDEPNGQLMIHAEPSNMPFAVPLDFLYRHNPTIGGYFVVYEDGYISYSPAAAFEAGYSIIIDEDSNGTVLAQNADGTETITFQDSRPASPPNKDPKVEPVSPPDRSVMFTFTIKGIGDDRFEPLVLVAMEEYVKERRNREQSNPFFASNGVAVKWFNNDIDDDNDLPNSDWGKEEGRLFFVKSGRDVGVNLHNLDALMTDMPPHQLRVMEELADLALKLQKLTAFFDTDTYRALDVDERGRLKEQSLFMQEYQRVLMERVAAFQ